MSLNCRFKEDIPGMHNLMDSPSTAIGEQSNLEAGEIVSSLPLPLESCHD